MSSKDRTEGSGSRVSMIGNAYTVTPLQQGQVPAGHLTWSSVTLRLELLRQSGLISCLLSAQSPDGAGRAAYEHVQKVRGVNRFPVLPHVCTTRDSRSVRRLCLRVPSRCPCPHSQSSYFVASLAWPISLASAHLALLSCACVFGTHSRGFLCTSVMPGGSVTQTTHHPIWMCVTVAGDIHLNIWIPF